MFVLFKLFNRSSLRFHCLRRESQSVSNERKFIAGGKWVFVIEREI